MHVMLLHSRPFEFGKTVGGVPEFLTAVVVELKKMGMRVSVYCGDKNAKSIRETILPGHEIKIYNGPLLEPAFFISHKKIKPIAELCRREKIDILHAQGTYTPGFMVRELGKMTGLPYIITSHGDLHPVNSKRLSRRNVRTRCQRILRDAAWVTHLTPVMETASHQICDTTYKSSLIHNGIHLDEWLPYRKRDEKNYLLGIGRLERGKGFHILIDMYAELVKRGVTSSLVIAGTGQEDESLRAQCQSLGLETISGWLEDAVIPEKSVIFAGYVRNTVKYKIIAESQCVLFATQPDLWEEAFGIVQLEAMAAGKPLIASDIAATRYLLKLGMQAKIVEPQNKTAWADAVETLVNNHDLRLAMGQANAAASQQFSWQGVAKNYYDVYRAVLTGLPNGLNA
jgi:glycosyltransferase involved in cell wall biosynthesis